MSEMQDPSPPAQNDTPAANHCVCHPERERRISIAFRVFTEGIRLLATE